MRAVEGGAAVAGGAVVVGVADVEAVVEAVAASGWAAADQLKVSMGVRCACFSELKKISAPLHPPNSLTAHQFTRSVHLVLTSQTTLLSLSLHTMSGE